MYEQYSETHLSKLYTVPRQKVHGQKVQRQKVHDKRFTTLNVCGREQADILVAVYEHYFITRMIRVALTIDSSFGLELPECKQWLSHLYLIVREPFERSSTVRGISF